MGDYSMDTKQAQIWYANEESTFEKIKLHNLKDWTPANLLKISEYKTNAIYKNLDFIPQRIDFEPMDLCLLQRVSVLYRTGFWYTAFIDGFDKMSRRHHINYGDTSEWIWASPQNIKKNKWQINETRRNQKIQN